VTLDQIIASPVTGLLAAAGGVALAARLAGAALRAGFSWLEAAALRALAETSMRNGDLTAMAERREHALRVRRARRRSALLALLWLGMLLVPLAFGVARPAYALASVLWLLPGGRVRFRMTAGRTPAGSAVETRPEP
jgi:hypothetical protein